MTPREMAEITEIERAEIMSEIEARHAPKFHGSQPCPSGGCCSCGTTGGCDTGIALNSLAAAVAQVAALRALVDDRQGYIHSEFHDYKIKWTECPRLICVDARAALAGMTAPTIPEEGKADEA